MCVTDVSAHSSMICIYNLKERTSSYRLFQTPPPLSHSVTLASLSGSGAASKKSADREGERIRFKLVTERSKAAFGLSVQERRDGGHPRI